jgi:hypothetical protein
LAAGAHHPPEFADLLDHVGNEEDRKHANDGIQRTIRKAKRFHVADAKLNVLQSKCGGFRTRHDPRVGSVRHG